MLDICPCSVMFISVFSINVQCTKNLHIQFALNSAIFKFHWLYCQSSQLPLLLVSPPTLRYINVLCCLLRLTNVHVNVHTVNSSRTVLRGYI